MCGLIAWRFCVWDFLSERSVAATRRHKRFVSVRDAVVFFPSEGARILIQWTFCVWDFWPTRVSGLRHELAFLGFERLGDWMFFRDESRRYDRAFWGREGVRLWRDCRGAVHKRSQVKNEGNPGVKSTSGAPTSLRSAAPPSITSLDIQERIYELRFETAEKFRAALRTAEFESAG